MKSKNVLEANEIPQVAMDAMNDIHRDELQIVNNINEAILNHDTEQISLFCKDWLEHTKAHFERENYMMEKYDFPAFHCHQNEHFEAMELLEKTLAAWFKNADLDELSAYVQKTWPEWYLNHISTMDVITSAFIKQSMDKER